MTFIWGNLGLEYGWGGMSRNILRWLHLELWWQANLVIHMSNCLQQMGCGISKQFVSDYGCSSRVVVFGPWKPIIPTCLVVQLTRSPISPKPRIKPQNLKILNPKHSTLKRLGIRRPALPALPLLEEGLHYLLAALLEKEMKPTMLIRI